MDTYGTNDEIRFLQGLGTHRLSLSVAAAVVRSPDEYRAGLARYERTMPARERWGNIDPEKVRAWIRAERARVLSGGAVPAVVAEE